MRTAPERHAALLVLGAGGGLAGVAALFSAGSSSSRLLWLGLAALVLSATAATAAALGWWPVLSREALIALGLLIAFVCWCGISILWSIEPDRSWEYFNRGLVYVAFAVMGLAVGVYVPRAARLWGYALAGVVALALGWALLGKAVPAIGGSGRVARLNSPVDYWNGLALLFDLAVPLALWLAARRDHPLWLRAAGVVFLYGLVIGLLLTASRAGLAVAVLAIAVWLAFGGPRIEGAAALLLGGGVGLAVGVWALSRPGLATDNSPHSTRVHDGAWFAVVFVLTAVAVAAVADLAAAQAEAGATPAGRPGRAECPRGGCGRRSDRSHRDFKAAGLVPRLHARAEQHRAEQRGAAAHVLQLEQPLAVVGGSVEGVREAAAARDRGGGRPAARHGHDSPTRPPPPR